MCQHSLRHRSGATLTLPSRFIRKKSTSGIVGKAQLKAGAVHSNYYYCHISFNIAHWLAMSSSITTWSARLWERSLTSESLITLIDKILMSSILVHELCTWILNVKLHLPHAKNAGFVTQFLTKSYKIIVHINQLNLTHLCSRHWSCNSLTKKNCKQT